MSLDVGNKTTFGRKGKCDSMKRNECFHSLMSIQLSILIKTCPILNSIWNIWTIFIFITFIARKWSNVYYNSKEYSIRKL